MNYRVCDAITMTNLFNEQECRDIIYLGLGAKKEEARLQFPDGTWKRGRGRDCSISWIPKELSGVSWIFQRISYAMNKVNDDSYGFRVKMPTSLQFTEYKPLQKYDWHFDNGASNDVRLLTCVVNLQNAVLGGGTNIRARCWENGEHASQVGAATFFPCYLLHKAKKVWLGTRYSLVGWATSWSQE